ncbi:10944_t:CDS:2 [Ambispora gerdemannii]|uniref:10944_t:CDS:1 n=1 Tax=Ambispora gerdemannii TaxID=144530 RepID=A0A9N9GJP1_9GLOM|nr:10944_t:CDS:2 [Ambispora gerdemannii]
MAEISKHFVFLCLILMVLCAFASAVEEKKDEKCCQEKEECCFCPTGMEAISTGAWKACPLDAKTCGDCQGGLNKVDMRWVWDKVYCKWIQECRCVCCCEKDKKPK